MNYLDTYTSTGTKFWRHPYSMISYLWESGRSVISTHISPEGKCNLKCSYCSVSKRNRHFSIDYNIIIQYLKDLISRGLKAVILTGGGEPTIYPRFNDLIKWIKKNTNLKIGLITNGTFTIDCDWDSFDWIRISINDINKIKIIKTTAILGCSVVYTNQTFKEMQAISKMIHGTSVQYVRVLPDCMAIGKELDSKHVIIESMLKQLNNNKFFHQPKKHRVPKCSICHQSYFRPYLSEVGGGTVFPCDSLVLNNSIKHFDCNYAICKASDILKFLDKKIKIDFDPRKSCPGCVFTDNVEMIDNWTKGVSKFHMFKKPMIHEEFV